MNQSKVRREHDPWHEAHLEERNLRRQSMPLKPHIVVRDQVVTVLAVLNMRVAMLRDDTYTEQRSDFVEITVSVSGLTACASRSGLFAGVPFLMLPVSKLAI